MNFRKDLYQGWDSCDEAIDFFLNLCLELTALKRLPDPPVDVYVHVTINGKDLTDVQLEKLEVTLETL